MHYLSVLSMATNVKLPGQELELEQEADETIQDDTISEPK